MHSKRPRPIWLLPLVALLAVVPIGALAAQPANSETEAADQTSRESHPPSSRMDRYGDPLPPGATARLGTMRFRHPGPIAMLALTPSGAEAITLSQGSGMLRRCDLKSGRVSDFFDLGAGFGGVSSGRRTSLAFDGSGGRLIVAGPNYVQLIDVEKNTSQKVNLPQGFAVCSALSADKKRLAIVQTGDNGRLLIINTESGKIDRDIPRVGNNPTDVAFTHDGAAVTISTHNRAEGLRTFSIETGKELPPIKDTDVAAMSLAYSPNGKWLAVGHAQTSVVLFDLVTKQTRSFGGFTSAIRWVDFTPDSRYLLAYDGSGTLSILNPESGEELRKIAVGISQTVPAISSGGKTVITAFGNVLDAWNIESGQPESPLEGHRAIVVQTAVSPNGRLGATLGQDNTLRLWDLMTGAQLRVKQRPRYAAQAVTFTADGKYLLWAPAPTSIEFLDVAVLTKSEASANDIAREVRGNQFSTFSVSEDSRTLLANNSAGGGTQVWDLSKKNPSSVLIPPALAPQGVTFVAFSPDARLSATPYTVDGNTHQVVIADVNSGREVARLPSMPGRPIQQGIFAGARLIATRDIRQIALWDVLSARPVINVAADGAGMTTALSCSSDGRLLAWAENDSGRTIRLYDSLNARIVATFAGHTGVVQSLQIQLADEHPVLVSASQDSTALVWDLTNVVNDLRRTTPQLADQKPEQLWADLGAEDAAAMHRAAWVLSAAGHEAAGLLGSRLQAVPVDQSLSAKIDKLVAQMDDDQFSVREQASLAAVELGEAAEPFLSEALKRTTSAEARHRIRRILADIAGKPLLLSAEQQRSLRAVQILEQIGDAQSREVLLRLAAGQPSARLTAEAKNALARLEQRSVKQ